MKLLTFFCISDSSPTCQTVLESRPGSAAVLPGCGHKWLMCVPNAVCLVRPQRREWQLGRLQFSVTAGKTCCSATVLDHSGGQTARVLQRLLGIYYFINIHSVPALKTRFWAELLFFLCVWLHSADRRCGANGSSSTAHFIIRIYPVGEFYWPLSALNAEAAAFYMPVYLSTTGIQGSYWWACNTNIQPRKAATERMDVRTCACVSSEVVSTCERC